MSTHLFLCNLEEIDQEWIDKRMIVLRMREETRISEYNFYLFMNSLIGWYTPEKNVFLVLWQERVKHRRSESLQRPGLHTNPQLMTLPQSMCLETCFPTISVPKYFIYPNLLSIKGFSFGCLSFSFFSIFLTFYYRK